MSPYFEVQSNRVKAQGDTNMLEKIKTVLVDAIGVEADDVVPEASLSEDLQIDSLAAVELALELESEFDITIEDEELAGLKTVQDIMDLLAEKMN